jgi:hypothetical protein
LIKEIYIIKKGNQSGIKISKYKNYTKPRTNEKEK